jgi:hypothetical protein
LQNGKGTAITALGVSGTVTATKLVPTGNVTAGNGMYLPATNQIAIGTNGSERVRIDASGNVGVGATAPASGFNLAIGSNNFGLQFVNGNKLRMFQNNSINHTLGVESIGSVNIESGGGASNITFITDSAERMRITTAGVVELAQGQIKFPATQVASADPNTLDDYEEGTFDFGIAFGGSSTGVTYGSRQGKYTKIGNKVTVTGFIQLTNKGAEVGIVTITGLPFAIGNSNANYSTASIWFNNITFANQFQGFGEINDTKILLYEVTEAGALTNLTDGDFSNNSQIVVSFTYFVS